MDNKTIYIKHNSSRKPKYNLRTEIKKRNGEFIVYKIADNPKSLDFLNNLYKTYKSLATLELPFEVNKAKLINNKILELEYVNGKSLLKELKEKTKTQNKEEILKTFKDFEENILGKIPTKKTHLTKDFENIFGKYSNEKEYDAIYPGILDPNLDNIIKDKDGQLHLIDYEWTFDFPIPKNYILFRTVFNAFVSLKSSLSDIVSFEQIGKTLGLSKSEIDNYFEWEVNFQMYVSGAELTKTDLSTHKDSNVSELLKKETLLTSKAENEHTTNLLKEEKEVLKGEKRVLKEEKRVLKEEKDKLEREYNNLKPDADEFRVLKQTKIWKVFTMYRKIKKYTKNFIINIFRDGPIVTFKRIFQRIDKILKYRKQRKIDQNKYQYWLKNNRLTSLKKFDVKKEIGHLEYKPLISIIMPVYNVDVKWIKEAVKSVEDQIYSNWELCIADDASTNQELKKYLKKISRNRKIKVVFRKKNGHISEASNSALKLATGEFVALMDNDDVIHPHALAEVVKVLNEKRDTDFIYSDEDKMTIKGERLEPFFKPDWSPDLFLSTNYLCHLTVIRKKLVDDVGGFRKGYEGSQDYDLFLRVTEKTNNIEHIPDILYSWRKIPGSTAAVYGEKSYADDASQRALSEALKRRKLDATVTKGLFPGSFRVRYKIEGEPLVSILIPTLDKYKYIERCIFSIFEKTTYDNFEVIIIDTGSKKKKVLEYYKKLKSNPKIRFLHWNKRFNYSAVNNYGVKHAKGDYLLFLNNDTEIITPHWIEGMLEHAQREEIGAVGVKLYYPNDTIQHAGVVLGIAGPSKGESIAGHIMRTHPRQNIIGIPYTIDLLRNYSAITAACLMISKKKFLEVGGLNEDFRIAFNDVDFCLKLMDKGYYNIYTPYVELYHHESVSVGAPKTKTRNILELDQEVKLMKKKWGPIIQEDPFYNINFQWENTGAIIKTDS